LVREAAKRTLKQRHFDVQLIGGIVLHQGKIAEMKTGEGKTLASTCPIYLNALDSRGVHVITVNDYLARRDTVWMGQIYKALGLEVACLVHDGAFVYPKQPDEYYVPGTLYGGDPTPLYYFVKEELHKEFVNIAKELQALKSVGVYHTGMIPEGTIKLPKNNPFKLEPAVKTKACPGFIGGHYKDHNGIYPVNLYKKPLEGFVIGCFGENEKTTYALIVNLDHRTYSGAGQERRKEFKNPVKRKIVGSGPLEVFDAKAGKWRDAKGNRVKLQLHPGSCILVRLRK